MLVHQTMNSLAGRNYNSCRHGSYFFDTHFHINYEVIYVLEGRIELTVSGRTEYLESGDFAMVLSNEPHSLKPVDTCQEVILCFSPDFVPDFDKAVKNKTGNTSRFHCDETMVAYLKKYVLFSEGLEKRKQDFYQFTAGLYMLCGQYLSQVTLTERDSTQYSIMNEIAEYIKHNYTQDLKLQQVARVLGYDYYYCSRLFRKTFGMRFNEYLNSIRCSTAAELIRTTNKQFSQIALESGFQSIRAFNDVFAKQMGMTPLQYRKHLSD